MRNIVTILFALCTLSVCAQTARPDLHQADHSFFDPTRKQEKQAEAYTFSMDYRLEVGYAQAWQRSVGVTYPDMYLHGMRLGGVVDFNLPKHFVLQTGLSYTLQYGVNNQHFRSMSADATQVEYLKHRVLSHQLSVPVRCYYVLPVWKKLNLLVYTGPELKVGLAQTDYMDQHLSEGTKAWVEAQGIPTGKYDRYQANELWPANIQWGLGGGIEWDKYRLQAGYDFGLNNLVRDQMNTTRRMNEWGWYTSFVYKF